MAMIVPLRDHDGPNSDSLGANSEQGSQELRYPPAVARALEDPGKEPEQALGVSPLARFRDAVARVQLINRFQRSGNKHAQSLKKGDRVRIKKEGTQKNRQAIVEVASDEWGGRVKILMLPDGETKSYLPEELQKIHTKRGSIFGASSQFFFCKHGPGLAILAAETAFVALTWWGLLKEAGDFLFAITVLAAWPFLGRFLSQLTASGSLKRVFALSAFPVASIAIAMFAFTKNELHSDFKRHFLWAGRKLACLLAHLLARLLACLLACSLTCLLACLLALASLLSAFCFPFCILDDSCRVQLQEDWNAVSLVPSVLGYHLCLPPDSYQSRQPRGSSCASGCHAPFFGNHVCIQAE